MLLDDPIKAGIEIVELIVFNAAIQGLLQGGIKKP